MDEKSVISAVTYNILAPSLNQFVLWILKEAIKHKKKRLYFLARDGYFMYQYAKRYVEYFRLPIECRYLCCSRYSLRVPMYQFDMEETLSYITLGGLDVSLEKIMRRASITKEQEERVLQELKLPYEVNEQIPRQELEKVKDALGSCDSFLKYVQMNSKEVYPRLKQYVIQEGLLDDIPMAIVDSGWVGSMQKQLNQLINTIKNTTEKNEKLEGYYWGLYELPQGVGRNRYHTYYFSPEGEIQRKVYFSNCLFEGIFSAPHGMTIGYTEDADGIHPQFADISKERIDFLLLTQEHLMTYQQKMISTMNQKEFMQAIEVSGSKQSIKDVKCLMKRLMSKPGKEVAAVYGQIYFADDVLEDKDRKMAEPMSESELWKNHLFYRVLHQLMKGKQPVRQSAWFEGSAAIYSRYPTIHRIGYSAYKYFLYYRQRHIWRHNNEQ